MTANEAIRTLKDDTWIHEVNEDGTAVLWTSYADKFTDALDLAISALERDRWISVEERLPENADIYLCTLMSYAGKFRYIDTLKYIGGFFYENGVGTDRVTNWRPLPEPPKEET